MSGKRTNAFQHPRPGKDGSEHREQEKKEGTQDEGTDEDITPEAGEKSITGRRKCREVTAREVKENHLSARNNTTKLWSSNFREESGSFRPRNIRADDKNIKKRELSAP